MYSDDDDDPTLSVSVGKRAAAARRSKNLGLGLAWMLNAILLIASAVLILSWGAFDWVIGSAAWGTIVEV